MKHSQQEASKHTLKNDMCISMYVKVTKGFMQVSTFPCVDVVSWIVSHIDPKTRTLNNAIGHRLAYFLAPDYDLMYHLPELELLIDSVEKWQREILL